MELHHKLRRDPNWHPNGCNICGQLGHQAANCTNGTIRWREIYGDDAFQLKQAVFWSDVLAHRKSKQEYMKILEETAKEYAQGKCKELGINYEDVVKAAEESQTVDPGIKRELPATTAAADQEEAPAKKQAVDAAQPAEADAPALPDGWAEARDSTGRVYFWHKKTQKTQWERPTESTPIE